VRSEYINLFCSDRFQAARGVEISGRPVSREAARGGTIVKRRQPMHSNTAARGA